MEAAKASSSESFGNYQKDFRTDPDRNQGGTTVEPERNHPGNSEADSSSLKHRALCSSLDGLEDFYQGGSTLPVEHDQGGSTVEPVLSLKEAVEFYKISEKTIRLHIAQGKISACKEVGPRGPEWRIYPAGLPSNKDGFQAQRKGEDDPNQGGTTLEVGTDQGGSTLEVEHDHGGKSDQSDLAVTTNAPYQLEKLLDVIKAQSDKLEDAHRKLESANYRIGYLESQTQTYQEQVKLLTDSQRRSGWWSRFSSWFLGR